MISGQKVTYHKEIIEKWPRSQRNQFDRAIDKQVIREKVLAQMEKNPFTSAISPDKVLFTSETFKKNFKFASAIVQVNLAFTSEISRKLPKLI